MPKNAGAALAGWKTRSHDGTALQDLGVSKNESSMGIKRGNPQLSHHATIAPRLPDLEITRDQIKIEALAQLGKLIPEAQERGELRSPGRHPKSSDSEQLDRYGIDRKTSMIAQRLAYCRGYAPGSRAQDGADAQGDGAGAGETYRLSTHRVPS